MSLRGMLHAAGLALLLGVANIAAAQSGTPPPAAPALQPAPEARVLRLSFQQLGVYGSATLRGVEGTLGLPFGVRLDEVVTSAKLRLRYTASPALLADLSHLRVVLNEQVVVALPLPREEGGVEVRREVSLDPTQFTDFNLLRLDLIGHYARECEDPAHSSLWTAISDQSELELTLQPLPLQPDLALLPAPFFDRRDNSRLVLPMVMAQNASLETLHSAGVLASWFGALASYRSARFPVLQDELPATGHALVLATNAQRPAGLALDEVEAPTLRLLVAPGEPAGRLLLVLQGADDAQLRTAAEALVLGQAVLSGQSATVQQVDRGTRRPAYDAPNWVRTDRPVKLGELVDNPQDLQARGQTPPPLRVNLRLPPDLLTWNRRGVPLDLKYRYTPPARRDASMLTVSINDQLLKAFPLRPGVDGESSSLQVPLLGDGTRADSGALVIPPFQLGANNQLQFQFALESPRDGACRAAVRDTTRAAIDPDSTLDLSGFPHYTAMPNLALFANAAYPFTRYADLAETSVVLPAQAQRGDVEAYLFLMGRMGRITGVPALRYTLLAGADAQALKDRDVLLVGAGREGDLLSQWGAGLGVVLERAGRAFTSLPAAGVFPRNPLEDHERAQTDQRVAVSGAGPLAVMLGFESPLTDARSVVALAATGPAELARLIDSLEDESRVGRMRGDTVVLRGAELQSFESGPHYHVGALSVWMRVWYHLSLNPLLMLVLAMVGGVLLAFGLYGYLRRAAERRLAG